MRRSDPAAQSDREPALGHAHQPARRTGRQRALQPQSQARTACGCSRSAACSCASPARRKVLSTWRASASRCAWAPPPSDRRLEEQWGVRAASGRLLRRQGRPRSAAGAAAGTLRARAASGAAPRPQRPSRCSRDGRSAGSANCIRAGSRSTSCRARWSCSKWTQRPCSGSPVPAYREVPSFPPVSRDLSVIAARGRFRCRHVLDDLTAHRPAAVEAIQLFDLYRGTGVENGKKSLAFRVLLQDTQKTMTDAEVDAAVQQVRQRLQERFGGQFGAQTARTEVCR